MNERLKSIVSTLAGQLGLEYSLSDPFGLSQVVFVAIFPRGRERGPETLYLTFEPHGDDLSVRDYVNGYATFVPTVPVPADADAKWFCQYMG